MLGILNHDGAFADFVRLPAMNLHVAAQEMSMTTQAVFVEPLAAAFQVLKQIKLDGRKWVTVLGDGRLGLLVAQVLRERGLPGARDRQASGEAGAVREVVNPLAAAWRTSCRATIRMSSSIAPAAPPASNWRCRWSARAGRSCLKSTVAAGKPLNLAPVVIDEINIVGSRCGPFREAIAALAEKRVDVASLIHRRMKLEQGVEAMDLAGRPGVLKVILTME